MEAFEGWLAGAEAHRLASGRPLVTLSFAQSLDGSLAAQRGRPTQISGPVSQQMTHRLRAMHHCILVGIGTVLVDNPRLTVRLAAGENPQPVVLDSHLRTPPGARVLSAHPKPAWIAAVSGSDPGRRMALENAGGRVLILPEDQQGRVDLRSLLDCLAELGVSSLMVEGGAAVISSFLTHSLVDLVVLTIAPMFLGGLKSLEEGALRSDGTTLGQHPIRLVDTGTTQMGEDLVLWGRLADSGAF